MISVRKIFIISLVLLMNAACGGPTPYQKADDRGGLGYSDYQVKGNIYHIYVSGVPIKDNTVYRDYWHRRAKELCEGMGFQEYKIIEYKQDEGDPTPVSESASILDPRDPRYRAPKTLKNYSRSASVSGKVECQKKNK